MSTALVTHEELIEDTLSTVYRESERPMPVVLADSLSNAADTQFTLVVDDDSELLVSQLVEYGQELMLVTAKSNDATPVFTVSRGYAGTPTSSSVPSGAELLVAPAYARYRAAKAVLRGLDALTPFLPVWKSDVFSVVADRRWVELPAGTRRVFEVGFSDGTDYHQFDSWEFKMRFPTALVSTGKALLLPPRMWSGYSVYVTYSEGYVWTSGGDSPQDEADTVEMWEGSQDLPPMWAAAYLVTGRELTRMELDKVEEWNQEAAIRQGVNVRMVRELWSEYYRRLDEVRREYPAPKHRTYRRRMVV